MKILLIPFLLLLLNTCQNSNGANRVELNKEFPLKYQQSAFLKSEKISIRFQSLVEESRCPKSVQCIQAGKGVIELAFAKGKEESSVVQLSTDAGSDEVTQGKYKIKLVQLEPYPVNPGEKDPNRYVATLLVTSAP